MSCIIILVSFYWMRHSIFILRKRKKTVWNIWNSFPEVTEAFINLTQKDIIQENDFQLIECYVVLLYDKTSPLTSVNECHRDFFSKKCPPIESWPPMCNALIQHTKRAMLQSNIWLQSVKLTIVERDIDNFGWIVSSDYEAKPLRLTIPEASKICKELTRCSCKKMCKTCKCKKAELVCTELCACKGLC